MKKIVSLKTSSGHRAASGSFSARCRRDLEPSLEALRGPVVGGGAVSLEPRANVDDPLISRIALTIVSDIEGGILDHVLADALNTALAVRIIRLFVNPSAINLAPSNGLSREG